MAARKQPPQYALYSLPRFPSLKRFAILGSDRLQKSIRTQPTATPPDSLPPVGVQDETPIFALPIDAGEWLAHILMPNKFNKVDSSDEEEDDNNDSESEKLPSWKWPKRGSKPKPKQPPPKKSPKSTMRPRCRRGTCRLCTIIGGCPNLVTCYGCVDCGLCFSIYHNSAKCATYNVKCCKIHDRLQEYFSLYPKALEFSIDREDAMTPSTSSMKKNGRGKQVNMCCKPKDVAMFEKHF